MLRKKVHIYQEIFTRFLKFQETEHYKSYILIEVTSDKYRVPWGKLNATPK
jgi:hypothetical protein